MDAAAGSEPLRRFNESDNVVELDVEIAAPSERVWRTIMHAGNRVRWWRNFQLDPWLGGRFVERWSDSSGRRVQTSGKVIALEHRRSLGLTWQDDDWPASTSVELTLSPTAAGTLVRLRHSGWEALGALGADLIPAHTQGWERHLYALKTCVETARPDELDVASCPECCG